MKIGLIGLKQSGKTTIFNALTGQEAETGFGANKLQVNMGNVKVPDSRLDTLTEIFNPKRKVNATVEYVDVAGVEGEGSIDPALVNQIKVTDALLVVVRAFHDDGVFHPFNTVDPMRDLQNLMEEFIISDQVIVENRLKKLEKSVKSKKDPNEVKEYEALLKIKDALENLTPLREIDIDPVEMKMLRGFQFLTLKPVLVVFNTDEGDNGEEYLEKFKEEYGDKKGVKAVAISGKIEEEISRLEDEDKEMFMEEYGIKTLARDLIIRESYSLLGLISFFTVGEDECRAWTIKDGTNAQKAAGAIHSDIERGFIRAEVVHYNDFIQEKSLVKCKEKGLLRLEGKDYIVKDGDIINFRFNV
ncbi:ribosome-binding ATPase [Thermotomaculum hydrothermale]|uniref:Ribosome-binding ATPase n=1 Tax=Thermotomaculum hydrothermale TaxID=981385 RepID=A0A7R6SYG8_9BACT|nr:redox-regulated ATPase YchF [Thermotomaculum hydrothermale]BBB31712.1 ribosome-binding ATPase [Thermotomaculum hydrothermale]